MRRWISCLLLAAVCAMQATAQLADSKIVLNRADGKTVEVPLTGPGRDPRAEQLAREIQVLDKQIARGVIGSKGDTPQNDPVQAEMLKLAKEARNDALADLDLALTVARITSAGALDNEAVARAKESARAAETILNTQPPNSVLVATEISTSSAGAQLHYMSKWKHRQRSTEWSSYSAGERLHIGHYVFRVQPPESNARVFEEFVLVMSDPTTKRLTPVRAADK